MKITVLEKKSDKCGAEINILPASIFDSLCPMYQYIKKTLISECNKKGILAVFLSLEGLKPLISDAVLDFKS